MPPKTAAATKNAAPGAPRKNDRKKDSKVEEAPASPSGPIIRSTISKASPPAPQGMSFLDAINIQKRNPEVPAAAAKPAAAAPPAAESSTPTPVKTPTPRKVAAPVAAPEPVPEVAPASNSQYNWAEEEYTPAQEPEPQPEPEPEVVEEPKPEFAVQYPESVLLNRTDIIFKAPASEQQLVANAMENLRQARERFENEKRSFALITESREADLVKRESDLVSREQQLRHEQDLLAADRNKLQQQQQQFHQQQQQVPPPAAQPTHMNPAAMHHMNQPMPQRPYGAMMGAYESWEQPQAYGDIYSNYRGMQQQQPFRPAPRGGRPNAGYPPYGQQPAMGYAPQNRSSPVAQYVPNQPRTNPNPNPNRSWANQ